MVRKKQYFLDRMACQLLVIKYLLSHNTISQKLIKNFNFLYESNININN